MHICVVGGGSAIAKEYISHCINIDKVSRLTVVHSRSNEVSTSARLLRTSSVEGVAKGIDAMVTFCGSFENCKLEEMSDISWERVLNANLTSVQRALRAGLPKMSNPGNVVVLGSIVGSQGGYGCASYAAAKAGLVGLVRAAANEWASRGVVVNLLELGYVDAGMGLRLGDLRPKIEATIPLRRFASVKEVIHAIDFLAATRYMTGGVLTLAGGLR